MNILQYPTDLLASNMWVIEESGAAIVVDPCRDLSPAVGLRVEKILLTHEHYDHISGVNLWKQATGAPVLCSEACAASLGDPKKNLARHFDVLCKLQTWIPQAAPPDADKTYVCAADETFRDRASFVWRGHTFLLFEIPGHSPGSIGVLADGKAFFSGDSLLERDETELRFPGGSRAQWREIARPRLAEVPADITVYPGHFAPFTLTAERRNAI